MPSTLAPIPAALPEGQRHGEPAPAVRRRLVPSAHARGTGPESAAHYRTRGAALDPHPLFDAAFYLSRNADLVGTGRSPLAHFIEGGAAEGRDPCLLFDTSWYLERNPDVAGSGQNPLVHFLGDGGREGRDPHPLFDIGWYRSRVPDIEDANPWSITSYTASEPARTRTPCSTPRGTVRTIRSSGGTKIPSSITSSAGSTSDPSHTRCSTAAGTFGPIRTWSTPSRHRCTITCISAPRKAGIRARISRRAGTWNATRT